MSPAEALANERRAIRDICDLARRLRPQLARRVARALATAGAEDESRAGDHLAAQAETIQRFLSTQEGE